MSKQELDNLVKIGQLKVEPGARAEFDSLVASARKRLADARNETLSSQSRFDLAYNAAHALPLLHCVGMVIAPKIDMWYFKRSPIRYGLDAKIWRVPAKTLGIHHTFARSTFDPVATLPDCCGVGRGIIHSVVR